MTHHGVSIEDRDEQIDALERAMRDHILDKTKGWPHRRGGPMPGDGPDMVEGCDDNCAEDIFDRLTRMKGATK